MLLQCSDRCWNCGGRQLQLLLFLVDVAAVVSAFAIVIEGGADRSGDGGGVRCIGK